MADPSEYELEAWRSIQRFKGRPLSRVARATGERLTSATARVGERSAAYLEGHPRAQSVVVRGQEVAARGGEALGKGAREVADSLPDWSETALGSARRVVGRVSRAGLSPTAVVAKHVKRGHGVSSAGFRTFAVLTWKRSTRFVVEERVGTTRRQQLSRVRALASSSLEEKRLRLPPQALLRRLRWAP